MADVVELLLAPLQLFFTAQTVIILLGSAITCISAVALISTRFLKKLIRWQHTTHGYEMEISTKHIILARIGALIGVIGGICSLILGNSL